MSLDEPPSSLSIDPVPSQQARPRQPVFRQLPRPLLPAGRPRLERLSDLELTVRIELGRARVTGEQLQALEAGTIIQLDRRIDDPVDVYVNDRLVARGEIVVVSGKLAVRLTEVVVGEAGKIDR